MSAAVDRGPGEPTPELVAWCEQHLGSPATQRFFGADHLSAVHGLRLADGRAVVLKVRGAAPRLVGCVVAHRVLHAAGVPCPRPLAGPHPLSERSPERWCTAESWEPDGRRRPGGDVAVAYAELAARIVSIGPAPAAIPSLEPPVPWLWYGHGAPDRTWPPPADDWWDPHRIEADLPAAVLDAARRARRRLLADDVRALPPVVAHADLSGINVRWFPPREPGGPWRPLVHDWDSVVSLPDAVVAGAAAADHASVDECRLAPLDDVDRFLGAYCRVRGRAFTPAEVEVAWAAGVWVAAYNAAFEHLHGGPGPVTVQLELDADERLTRAGA